MKILIADYGAYPFVIQLCEKLSSTGSQITLAYSSFFGGPSSINPKKQYQFNEHKIELSKFPKDNFFLRVLHEFKFGKSLISLLRINAFDRLIFSNIPLISMFMVTIFCRYKQKTFIIWLHDLLSIAATNILSVKFKAIGMVLGKVFLSMEIYILKNASHIIPIAEEFKPYLEKWHIDLNKVSIIPNWAPVEDFPALPKKNDFSIKYHLNQKFVVLYSGTLGMKQNPQIIYDAACILKDHEDILFLVVSEGIGADYINSITVDSPLQNLQLLPFQVFHHLPQVLASADILLTILNEDAGEYCVPSKVWTYFCAQRPSILLIPENNQAAKITKATEAGIIISDYSADKLAESVLYLHQNRYIGEKMSKNAREYAQKSFTIGVKIKEFQRILE